MIRVFLVEDEVTVRENIKRMVPWEAYGFELVGEAADGELALPLIRKYQPDLLITDIKMPFMDGLTLCGIVKKEQPGIKIVILSGYDEFSYAQQAISIGVEDYLLKPIRKAAFVKRLEEIRRRFEAEQEKQEYYDKFKRELQEYEQHARRDFFETLIDGNMSYQEIYERADRLKLDIAAEIYNVLVFTLNANGNSSGERERYDEKSAGVLAELDKFFQENQECLPFRHSLFSYAVLIKGQKENFRSYVDRYVERLGEILSKGKKDAKWFIGVGEPVERISQLKDSYIKAMKAFSMRYVYDGHVMCEEEREQIYHAREEGINLESLDVNALDPDILKNFIGNGLYSEVDEFVKSYFYALGKESMESLVFRQYVMMNFKFSIQVCLKKMNIKTESAGQKDVEELLKAVGSSDQDMYEYAVEILKKAIRLRDENAGNQYRSVLKEAIQYIEQHYQEEEICLNSVAAAANVSPTHFSALFSQNMDKTFTEYLTEKRMNRAKELLRCSGLRSSEIAEQVGYKDSHYFSYLFKKTQGITPSDYRKAKGEA